MTDRLPRYASEGIGLPTAPLIHLASRHSLGSGLARTGTATFGSGASPFAANDMLAFPFVLTTRTPIAKLFWWNGTSAGGNTSMAIYDPDFVKLVQTSSTANSGSSVPQAVALTNIRLDPGLYYCAIAHDSATTNRYFRWTITTGGVGMWKFAGCWRQASVTLATLPTTATPVACNNIAFPVCGLITRTVFDL